MGTNGASTARAPDPRGWSGVTDGLTPPGGMSPFLPAGTQIGIYRIESLLDRGGMSSVYVATDTRLGRSVALKILSADLAQGADFRKRFLREARFAAAIDHPNIVPIYDAGEVDGLFYIAMRLVRGKTLAALIREHGALTSADTLAVLAPVADALDTAHAADLVHRDVKPANVLLTSAVDRGGRPHVYLGDFGLTRQTSSMTRLTVAGYVIGTMAYISPEQIKGQRVDARTDLYALGCVAHECLTGSPPFVRDDHAALLYAHLNDAPPQLSAVHPEMLRADGVLARALAKRPADRYGSCMQFAIALAEALKVDAPAAAAGTTGSTALGSTALGSTAPGSTASGSTASGSTAPGSTASTRVALRVVLVDDHELVRRGVADLLDQQDDLSVIGEASSIAEALDLVPTLRPDIAVLDMRLPDGNGVELCRELRSRLPGLNCLMLTSFSDEQAMISAIVAGAGGYAIKNITGRELVSAVRTVGTGGSLLNGPTAEAVLRRLRADAEPSGALDKLTPQERTVLALIGEGLTNRQIGERMSLAENTIKNYVSHVLEKLGVTRRAQAAGLASHLHDHRSASS
jgi:DNA-binding NarL/FixJ family response regulator/serine/threonine protein kinase